MLQQKHLNRIQVTHSHLFPPSSPLSPNPTAANVNNKLFGCTVQQFPIHPQLSSQAANTNIKAALKPLSEADIETIKKDIVWYGKNIELRTKVLEYLQANYEKVKLPYDSPTFCLEDYRNLVHEQTGTILEQQFIKGTDLLTDPSRILSFFEVLMADSSVGVKLSVHFSLFGGMIAYLGTKYHHDKILPLFEKKEHIGCFLMSEVAHASNLKKLGTTATYDKATKEFVIHTNEQENQKFWIGNAFKSATWGVVFAQLIDGEGKNRGLHPFLVQLRNVESREVLPGVNIKDCGTKMGLNGVDNGSVYFNQFRIPREYLLNRYANLTADGVYSTTEKNANVLFAKHIGALLLARIGVGASSITYSKVALSIALRYSLVRKQFGAPDTEEEVPILFYRTHQKRLMPLLAATYCQMLFQSYVQDRFYNRSEKELKEIHLLASVSKAALSWSSLETIQSCREACGGQGYLQRNLISLMRTDADILVTLDGDNHLLLQQIAQVLLSKYRKKYNGKGVGKVQQLMTLASERFGEMTRNGLISSYYSVEPQHLRSHQFIVAALKYRHEKLLHTLAQRLLKKTASQTNVFDAFNECQVHLVTFAKAYCDYIIAEKVASAIDNLELKYGSESPIVHVYRIMFALYGLDKIEKDGAFFLEHKVISSNKFKAIRKETASKLIKELATYVPSLIDGFAIPEFLFKDTIAQQPNYASIFDFANISSTSTQH